VGGERSVPDADENESEDSDCAHHWAGLAPLTLTKAGTWDGVRAVDWCTGCRLTVDLRGSGDTARPGRDSGLAGALRGRPACSTPAAGCLTAENDHVALGPSPRVLHFRMTRVRSTLFANRTARRAGADFGREADERDAERTLRGASD
jgi:hypothetical protein